MKDAELSKRIESAIQKLYGICSELQNVAYDLKPAPCGNPECNILTKFMGNCVVCGRCVHASCSMYGSNANPICSSMCWETLWGDR